MWWSLKEPTTTTLVTRAMYHLWRVGCDNNDDDDAERSTNARQATHKRTQTRTQIRTHSTYYLNENRNTTKLNSPGPIQRWRRTLLTGRACKHTTARCASTRVVVVLVAACVCVFDFVCASNVSEHNSHVAQNSASAYARASKSMLCCADVYVGKCCWILEPTRD